MASLPRKASNFTSASTAFLTVFDAADLIGQDSAATVLGADNCQLPGLPPVV
jgi:hypothetical protein